VTFHVHGASPHSRNRFAGAGPVRGTLKGHKRRFGREKRDLEIGKRNGFDLTRHLGKQVDDGGLSENAEHTDRHQVIGHIGIEELRIFVLQRLPELLF